MTTGPNGSLVFRSHGFALAAGLIAAAIGSLVLSGKFLPIEFPGKNLITAVKVETAQAFLILGAALCLQQCFSCGNTIRRGTQLCVSVGLVLGLVTLAEYLFRWNQGIDESLFQGSLAARQHDVGRVSILTALNLTLLGTALLDFSSPSFRRFSQQLALLATLVSLGAAVAYLYNIHLPYRVVSGTPMTAVTFLLLSLGTLATHPDDGMMSHLMSDKPGSQLARRMLPAAVLLPIILGWVRLRGQLAGYYGTEVGLALYACSNVCIFVSLVTWNMKLLNKSDEQRREAERALQQAKDTLELEVTARTLELSQANSTLESTLSWQREILRSANVGIISTDKDGIITTFNQGAEKLLGYSAAEVVGISSPVAFHDPAEVEKRSQQLAQELKVSTPPGFETYVSKSRAGQMDEQECTYVRKDGSRVPVLLSITSLRNDAGEVTGFLGISIDVSARVEAEKTLRRLNEDLEEGVRQRTAELEGVNHRLRLSEVAIDESSVATCWMNRQGQIRRVNRACTELLRFSREELLQMEFLDLIADSPEAQKWASELARCEAGTRVSFEAPLRRQDGGSFPAGLDVSFFHFEGEEYLFVYIRDLSEQKRAEAAIRQSESRLQGIVNSAMDAIITIDSQQNIVLFTPAAERLFGYSQKEMLGQSVDRLLPERFRPMHPRQVEEFSETKTTARKMGPLGIVSGLKKTGEEFPAEASMSQIQVGDQKLFTAILRDITDRVEAENSIRESEERFRLLVDGVQDHALIMLDPQGIVVSWNPGAERIQGYSADEIIGQHFSRFYIPEDADLDIPAKNLQTALAQGRYETEGWRIRKGGARFWASVIYTPMQDESGELRGFMKITHDITDRKRAELELRAKNEEIQTMSQQLWQTTKLATMGELAASIAHELNNPLATVSLRLESVLLRLPEADPARRSLEVADQEIERIGRLVSNLLQFSRRSGPQISTISVQSEIDGTLELIQYQLRNRGINLVREFDPTAPQIQGDSQRLRQLFLNLFTNASDAMPQGGTLRVRVNASSRLGAEYPAQVAIDISDTGAGIDPEVFPRIFESFYTTKPEGKGTGLGLPICKRIVEEHGGTFTLESEVGQGTTATIILPVTFSSSARHVMEPDQLSFTGSEAGQLEGGAER